MPRGVAGVEQMTRRRADPASLDQIVGDLFVVPAFGRRISGVQLGSKDLLDQLVIAVGPGVWSTTVKKR